MTLLKSVLIEDIRMSSEHEHILNPASIRLLIKMKKLSRDNKQRETEHGFNCRLLIPEQQMQYIEKLKKSSKDLENKEQGTENREQLIFQLTNGISVHYVTLDVLIQENHLTAFLVDASNCEEFFPGFLKKIRSLFDKVYYAEPTADNSSQLQKLQNDFISCPFFSFDHASKLSKFHNLYTFLSENSDDSGKIAWNSLPPRLIWNAQSISGLNAYSSFWGAKSSNAIDLKKHLNPRTVTKKIENNQKILNYSINNKKKRYQEKSSDFVEKNSVKIILEILFPIEGQKNKGKHNFINAIENLNYSEKELEKIFSKHDLYQIVFYWKDVKINTMAKKIHQLKNSKVKHFILENEIDVLDALYQSSNLIKLCENKKIKELVQRKIITPTQAINLPLYRIDRLSDDLIWKSILNKEIKIEDVLKKEKSSLFFDQKNDYAHYTSTIGQNDPMIASEDYSEIDIFEEYPEHESDTDTMCII